MNHQDIVGVTKKAGGRFVGRTSTGDASIIAKLPSTRYPRRPQLESLSMSLAGLAGVDVCQSELSPLSASVAPYRYDLGDELDGQFLAVTRSDRKDGARVHFEDFAQVFGLPPEQKYAESYLAIASILLSLPRCAEPAVHELLRRIEVNELLGNADMDLKNMGLLYRDRHHADACASVRHHFNRFVQRGARSRADIAARCAKPAFDADLQPDPLAGATRVVREVAAQAAQNWLQPILASGLTPKQKRQLLTNLATHTNLAQAIRRLRRPDLGEAWNHAAK